MNVYKMTMQRKEEEYVKGEGGRTRYIFGNDYWVFDFDVLDEEMEQDILSSIKDRPNDGGDFKGIGTMCEIKNGKRNYNNSMLINVFRPEHKVNTNFNRITIGTLGTSANETEFDAYHSFLEADRIVQELLPGYTCRYHPEYYEEPGEFDLDFFGEFDMRDHDLLDEGLSREEVLEIRKGDSMIKNLLKSGKTCEEIADFCHFNLRGVKAVEAEFRSESQK